MKEFVISEVQVETAVLVGLITKTQDERKTNEYLDGLCLLCRCLQYKKMCAKMANEGMDSLIRRFHELTVAIFRCCKHINQRNPQNIAA